MTINLDLSVPRNEVRVLIGDAEQPYLIDDSVIDFLLTSNDDDVEKAAVKALEYIVKSLAKKIDEEVGDVRIRWSQLRRQYLDVLTNLQKTQLTSLHLMGGTRKDEYDRVRKNPNSKLPPLKEGFFTDTNQFDYDPNNPFFLDRD